MNETPPTDLAGPEISAEHIVLLDEFERFIHRDPARRGLIGAELDATGQAGETRLAAGQLAASAIDLARHARRVAIVTGFFIPHAQLACAETDGPPGSLFLASYLHSLGIDAAVITDGPCAPAVRAAADGIGFPLERIFVAPLKAEAWCDEFLQSEFARDLTHLIAVERVGPSHTPESIAGQRSEIRGQRSEFSGQQSVARGQKAGDIGQEYENTISNLKFQISDRDAFLADVAPEHHNRCHNMRGVCIDAHTAPLHLLFERLPQSHPTARTIGIGDGGNEIGMGSIPWAELRRRLAGDHAGRVPCRIACDFNIVAGTSNWGAMALAAATCVLRDRLDVLEPWTQVRQQSWLKHIVVHGPAVDGITGRPEPTVDGLPFLTYIQPWEGIRRKLGWSD